MKRADVLRDFLNAEVHEIEQGLYEWRGQKYEVLPYSVILKRGGWSQFIKWNHNKRIYGIRPISDTLIKKYYGKKK